MPAPTITNGMPGCRLRSHPESSRRVIMNPIRSVCLGTAGGSWPDRARALLNCEGSPPEPDAHGIVGGQHGISLDADAPAALRACGADDLCALVFIEHPARALAHAMERGESLDLPAWAANWQAAARDLLELVHAARAQVRVIDADAARATLEPLIADVRRWAGLPSDGGNDPGPAVCDPVTLAVARQVCDLDERLGQFHDELLASRNWPAATWSPPPQLRRGQPVIDALVRLRQETTRITLRAASAEAERTKAESAARDARQEQARAEARIATSEAAAARDRQSHEQALAQAQAALAQALKDAEEARRQTETTAVAVTPETADEGRDADVKAALAAERQENANLLDWLLAAQDALDSALQQPKEAPAATLLTDTGDDDALVCTAITITHQRDERPYRELALALRDTQLQGRRVDLFQVRLVEHHGHPGLAVFRRQDKLPAPWEPWVVHGQEDGVPYQLIVPHDQACRAWLDSLDTLSWRGVRALAMRVERAVALAEPTVERRWRGLARRLVTQLQSLPSRLRWQTVELADRNEDGIALRILDVDHGARRLTGLRLHLGLTGDGSVGLDHEVGGMEPLLSWPEGDDGEPVGRVDLPLTPGGPELTRWQALPLEDRVFFVALVRELPRLLQRTQLPEVTRAQASACAARLIVQARRQRLDQPPAASRLHRVVHRWLER